MSDRSSELVEISKLNGDFRRNYDKPIGAILTYDPSAPPGRQFLVLGRGHPPASTTSYLIDLTQDDVSDGPQLCMTIVVQAPLRGTTERDVAAREPVAWD